MEKKDKRYINETLKKIIDYINGENPMITKIISKSFNRLIERMKKSRPIKRKFNDKHELVNALKRLRNRTINEVKCNQHDKIFSGFTDLYYHITEYHPETILQSSSGSNSNPIDEKRYMERKIIHRKFNNIVSKIKQKKADYRTVNDWIAAMDMLQEFINGQRFIDFSIGEYRWNSMLTFIEQMMMIANKANEMPNIFAKQL
ncbi:hypothetical protein DERP_014398 [Dermatophagoides pteronyssinus]|uniref:Uncharacterized protein n=1 Tax=Dermatophagoides pteronyssinus TaxID=6956 RepID=A0ABQ8J5V9_DERPT|nr:hypothetical protein DERP_014398 [Dermatophagoides pteronyssinus]